MLSKEEMFCTVFARNSPYVDKFENDEGETITGHLLQLGEHSKYDAVAVLILHKKTEVEVVACKQMRIPEHPNKHLKIATETVYELARNYGVVQQVPF